MRTFHLHVEQTLEAPLEAVFRFFADASNLEAITPTMVGFKILTPRPIEMRVGTLIDYSIRLHGTPMRWRTRIDAWEPPDARHRRARFVDTQLKGPYRVWIHEHTFEARPNPDGCESTRVTDHVEYAVPGGPGVERLIERWFVRPRIDQIFEHRKQAMQQQFPSPTHRDRQPLPG